MRKFIESELEKRRGKMDNDNADDAQVFVARWQIFKPEIPIWVNFGVSDDGRCWYIFMAILFILRQFGIVCGFCGHFVYIFPRFGMLSQEESGNPDANISNFVSELPESRGQGATVVAGALEEGADEEERRDVVQPDVVRNSGSGPRHRRKDPQHRGHGGRQEKGCGGAKQVEGEAASTKLCFKKSSEVSVMTQFSAIFTNLRRKI
jgi:hypothetical protein